MKLLYSILFILFIHNAYAQITLPISNNSISMAGPYNFNTGNNTYGTTYIMFPTNNIICMSLGFQITIKQHCLYVCNLDIINSTWVAKVWPDNKINCDSYVNVQCSFICLYETNTMNPPNNINSFKIVISSSSTNKIIPNIIYVFGIILILLFHQ